MSNVLPAGLLDAIAGEEPIVVQGNRERPLALRALPEPDEEAGDGEPDDSQYKEGTVVPHIRAAVWLGSNRCLDELICYEQDTDSHTPQEEIPKEGHKACPDEAPSMMAYHPAGSEERGTDPKEEHREDQEYDTILLGMTPRITPYRETIASDG